MVLAAISFADPLMLAGLLAALIPIALHLLNRMRAPVVPFPTLRFLKITAQKTSRRRHIQQYFLLLVRVLVFALIAMAVAAPLIRGGSSTLAYGLVIMLLGGLALLVLSAVLSSSAMDRTRSVSEAPARSKKPGSTVAQAINPPAKPLHNPRAATWMFALIALLAALLLGGYSAYGLVSDRFFSGDRGEFSGRSTAMVIIFDNSHSMLAKADASGQNRLAIAKSQIRELLGQTIRPAEAAIVPTNPGDQSSAPALTGDMTRLVGSLDQLTAQGSARPMQERIRTALELLRNSQQPGKMLIIASDFARPAFADAEVFAPLKNLPWRKDLQIVLFPVARESATVPDVGITSFTLAEGTQRPVVGAELTFEAQLINNADAADGRDYSFLVDGKPPDASAAAPLATRVPLGPGGTGAARQTLRIPYRLTTPGQHRFELRLDNSPDAMAWDDRRELTLDVADQIRVLVVGAEPANAAGNPRSRSAAFYLKTALAPFEGLANTPWSIKPVYRGIDQTPNAAALQGYAAVFLCDVPKIPPALADGLVAYAKTGGRIVWILGPSVNAADYNAQLAGTRNLLPAPLAKPLSTPTAAAIDWVDTQSGLFMNLFESQEPFRTVLVSGRWSLTGEPRGRVLAKLSDGSPIFTEHTPAGTTDSARIYTLLTTPAAAWSNLGATVLLVPLASRMALGDFTESGNTSYDTGAMAEISLADPATRTLALDITTPAGTVINVKPPPSATTAKWFFDKTYAEGLYHWKTSDGRHEGQFAVNPPGEEADLLAADVESLAKESNPSLTTAGGGKATIVAASVPELLAQLERRSEGTSLTPGFISLVLIFALTEAFMSNRRRS